MTVLTIRLVAIAGTLALAACGHGRDDVSSPSTTAPAAAATPTAATPAFAGTNPAVGGVAMLPSLTIVQNASAAPNLTTLVTAVKAADLVATLSGPGPFTVFAPTNEAFARLAPGTVDSLLKPENKASLVKLLTYHVVPGTITSAQLIQMIMAGGGTARLTSVEGDALTITMTGSIVTLTDVNGNKSYIETADIHQSNGVVHVVNGVLVPKLG